MKHEGKAALKSTISLGGRCSGEEERKEITKKQEGRESGGF